MATSMTSKGQVTVPKKIRDHLGLEPGMKIEFELDTKGHVVLRGVGAKPKPSGLAALRGSLDAKLSTDEILQLTRHPD